MAGKKQSPETPLTARFSAKEHETLRSAAETKGWSLAQLIRIGAYEKAVNILNATGEASYAVREVIGRVVKQLIAPELECERFGGEMEPLRVPRLDDEAIKELGGDDTLGLGGVDGIAPTQLSPNDLEPLLLTMRALGAELAPMVEQEFVRLTLGDPSTLSKLIDPSTGNEQPLGDGQNPSPEQSAPVQPRPSKAPRKQARRQRRTK